MSHFSDPLGNKCAGLTSLKLYERTSWLMGNREQHPRSWEYVAPWGTLRHRRVQGFQKWGGTKLPGSTGEPSAPEPGKFSPHGGRLGAPVLRALLPVDKPWASLAGLELLPGSESASGQSLRPPPPQNALSTD